MGDWFNNFWLVTTPGFHSLLGAEAVTLLRSSQVEPLTTGVDPSALAVAADAAAAVVTIDLNLAAGARANGYLCQGEQLLIGGLTYTVGVEIKIAGAALFSAVPITPALAAAAAAGTPVALLGAVYPFLDAVIYRDQARDDKGEMLAWEISARLSLPKLNAPTTPRQNDTVLKGDGSRLRLDNIISEDNGQWTFALGLPNA